jgi:hypothetical protein
MSDVYRVKELTQQLDELTKAKQDKETAADPRHSARLEIEASLGNKLLPPFIFYCFHYYFVFLYSGFIEYGSGSSFLG